VDKIIAFEKLIYLRNSVCLKHFIFENLLNYIIIDSTRTTIDILINNPGMLWEAIGVKKVAYLNLGGNPSVTI